MGRSTPSVSFDTVKVRHELLRRIEYGQWTDLDLTPLRWAIHDRLVGVAVSDMGRLVVRLTQRGRKALVSGEWVVGKFGSTPGE